MSAVNSQSYRLTDYIARSRNITTDLLTRIHKDIHERDILSSLIINVDDLTVAQLPASITLGGVTESECMVQVWDYADWRNMEEDSLSTDYDRLRFRRSTELTVLRHKVNEHLQYSFVVRSQSRGNAESFIKYVFVPVATDSRVILGTRQEITKSLEHDFLTGGLNRQGLLRELKQKFSKCPSTTHYSLLCFNIKNFRAINELHGSHVGDKVLQHFYTALVYSELHPISYARFEADNFMCLIHRDQLDVEAITRLCQRECLADDNRINYRCVCGIYHIDDCSISPVSACARARMAGCYVQDQFISPWKEFEPRMQQLAVSDSELLNKIELGLAHHEFEPYYQPIVGVRSGRIEMAEALVRWHSAEHGSIISPGEFIPVLERNGGLSRIGQLMEDQVFNLLRQRVQHGRSVVPIDINLTWTDFADVHLVEQIKRHILDKSLPSDLLRYEITEKSYDEMVDNKLDILQFFDKHNVKMLIDDFGQGYSFGNMKNVDFKFVKFDKSLIDQLGQSRRMDLIVRSLIDVFHQLSSQVIAEGVETRQQYEFLREAGCDYIQGFYFYKPMDTDSFIHLLDLQSTPFSPQFPQTYVGATFGRGIGAGYEPDSRPLHVKEINAPVTPGQELRRSLEVERCLRLLLDELNIHIFEWDVATHEDRASDKFCQMYHLPSNVIPNMPEEIPLVHEEDRDRFRRFYSRAANGEKMGSDYFRLSRPDGDGYTWFQKTFYTVFDEHQRPVKAIITMTDCDDRYRYRMLRTRDRMLTQRQEIVTFTYVLPIDTITVNYPNERGEVISGKVQNFLAASPSELLPDQIVIANNLRAALQRGERDGQFDFLFSPLGREFRAHYAMVDGEYGHLYAIVGQAEDIQKTRERLDASERLIRLSEIDGLTQIYNRSTGERLMTQRIRGGESGVFGILDCDKFKTVNDSFGHMVGDKMLIAIAALMHQMNPDGICMRLGGDEFAFCVFGDYTTEAIQSYIQHFFDCISNLHIPGMEGYPISVSIGAVIFSADEPTDFDNLYHEADVLLYLSKKSEGNTLTM